MPGGDDREAIESVFPPVRAVQPRAGRRADFSAERALANRSLTRRLAASTFIVIKPSLQHSGSRSRAWTASVRRQSVIMEHCLL